MERDYAKGERSWRMIWSDALGHPHVWCYGSWWILTHTSCKDQGQIGLVILAAWSVLSSTSCPHLTYCLTCHFIPVSSAVVVASNFLADFIVGYQLGSSNLVLHIPHSLLAMQSMSRGWVAWFLLSQGSRIFVRRRRSYIPFFPASICDKSDSTIQCLARSDRLCKSCAIITHHHSSCEKAEVTSIALCSRAGQILQ